MWKLEDSSHRPSLILTSAVTLEVSVCLGCPWLINIFFLSLTDISDVSWCHFTQCLLQAPSQDFISIDLGYRFRVKQVFWPLEWFHLVNPVTVKGIRTLASHTVEREIPGWGVAWVEYLTWIPRDLISRWQEERGIQLVDRLMLSTHHHLRIGRLSPGSSPPPGQAQVNHGGRRRQKGNNLKCLSPQTF